MQSRRHFRTVTNVLQDGRAICWRDSGHHSACWELRLTGISDAERAAIEGLFESSEGRLRPFLFLDPADNLLNWSEDFSKPVWHADPFLYMTPGVQEQLGTDRATRLTNSGPVAAGLSQTVEAPVGLFYCFSFYARTEHRTSITAYVSAAGDSRQLSTDITARRERILVPACLNDSSEVFTVGVTLQQNSFIELFGMQLEAQPAASGYKRTRAMSGIYPNARFEQDVLEFTNTEPCQHSCQLSIRANIL